MFPTGLPDEELMFENQWERHELAGAREFIGYPPVQVVQVDFQTQLPYLEGLPRTFPAISGSYLDLLDLTNESPIRIVMAENKFPPVFFSNKPFSRKYFVLFLLMHHCGASNSEF